MRLISDKVIENMSLCYLKSLVHHKITCDTLPELKSAIKRFQCTRSLIMWYNHLGLGCIILTAHVVYDPAVFYTQGEYEAKCLSIQSLIERHVVAAGSSSV